MIMFIIEQPFISRNWGVLYMRFCAHRDRRVSFRRGHRAPPAGRQTEAALAYGEPLFLQSAVAGTCTKLFVLLWMQLMAMEKIKSA